MIRKNVHVPLVLITEEKESAGEKGGKNSRSHELFLLFFMKARLAKGNFV